MTFQHQDLAEGAFEISSVVLQESIDYHGKDRYTVTLIIDDEEIELPATDEGDASTPEGDDIDNIEEDADEVEGNAEGADDNAEGIVVAEKDNLSTTDALVENQDKE